jgi:Amt family ammonium transporter
LDKSALDILWVVVASGLVFIMQAGFAMLESGLTRSKNSINVAIKNLTDLGVSALVFWAAGFALMFGSSRNGLFGASLWLFDPAGVWPMAFFLFQTMFCSTAATIVSGAVAERMRYGSYIAATVFMSLVIYPVFGHWAWGGALEGRQDGWLAARGFVDFAGSTVVHSIGGWVSLAILLVIGPRAGRYRPDGSTAAINGSSIPQAVLGVMILWFGWIGFNGGSTLGMTDAVPGIIVRTSLAAAAGMVGALALGWPLRGRPDVGLVLNGSLAGLVAITASCHAVGNLEAVAIGASGAAVAMGLEALLERLKIDDAVSAIPVHLGAGLWGTLCVGLFGDPERLGTGLDRWRQILAQLEGMAAAGAWSFLAALGFLLLLNRFRPIRVSADDERSGLNLAEHGVTTEILDLFTVLDEQSRTGDASLRAPVEPFTEAGQIAALYNQAMDKLEGSTVEKTEYLALLENLAEGTFMIEADRSVAPYYSLALEGIVRRTGLAGLDLAGLAAAVLAAAPDGAALAAALPDFVDCCFDPAYPWDQVERLNPLKDLEADFDDGRGGFERRYIGFDFKRLEKDGRVVRLFGIARDATDRRRLEAAMAESDAAKRSEMETLYRIARVDPADFADYLAGARAETAAINRSLRDGRGGLKPRLEEILRRSHALKGDSDMLGFDFIAGLAETMEKRIKESLARTDLRSDDLMSFTLAFGELSGAVDRLAEVAERYLARSAAPAAAPTAAPAAEPAAIPPPAGGGGLEAAIAGLAERLAGRYGKRVACRFGPGTGAVFAGLDRPARKIVRDLAVQLTRNALYHGIETPADREAAGKPAAGVLELALSADRAGLVLEMDDDGRGLDLEAVRRRAVERGLAAPADAAGLDDRAAAALIFRPGFSTAASDGLDAGKGIGLSLVAELARRSGGAVKLSSRPGRGCAFRVALPGLAVAGAPGVPAGTAP